MHQASICLETFCHLEADGADLREEETNERFKEKQAKNNFPEEHRI